MSDAEDALNDETFGGPIAEGDWEPANDALFNMAGLGVDGIDAANDDTFGGPIPTGDWQPSMEEASDLQAQLMNDYDFRALSKEELAGSNLPNDNDEDFLAMSSVLKAIDEDDDLDLSKLSVKELQSPAKEETSWTIQSSPGDIQSIWGSPDKGALRTPSKPDGAEKSGPSPLITPTPPRQEIQPMQPMQIPPQHMHAVHQPPPVAAHGAFPPQHHQHHQQQHAQFMHPQGPLPPHAGYVAQPPQMPQQPPTGQQPFAGHTAPQGGQPPHSAPPQQAPKSADHRSEQHERVQGNRYLPLPKRSFSCMSKQEIVYIIRNQLSYMSTSDPLADDFYYQVYNARKGETETGNFPTLGLFGSRPNPNYRNADGSPKLPQNTLGRIAASNLRKPKKLMDLQPDEESTPTSSELSQLPAPSKFVFASRTMPFLIEECIRVLMDMEDVDSLIVSHEDMDGFMDPSTAYEHNRLQQHRHALVQRLLEFLDLMPSQPTNPVDHVLFKFVALSKGRLLLFRALLLLPWQIGLQILHILLHNLKALALPEESSAIDGKLAKVASDLLLSHPPAAVQNGFFAPFVNDDNLRVMKDIAASQIGCLLIQIFMKKGHEVAVTLKNLRADPQANQGHLQFQEQLFASWKTLFSRLFDVLKGQFLSIFDAAAASKETHTATVSSLWELVAAVLLRTPKARREELKDELTMLLESKYSPIPAALAYKAATDDSKASDDKAPSISQAIRFVCSTLHPADHAWNQALAAIPLPAPKPTQPSQQPQQPQQPTQHQQHPHQQHPHQQHPHQHQGHHQGQQHQGRHRGNHRGGRHSGGRNGRGQGHRNARHNRQQQRQAPQVSVPPMSTQDFPPL